MKKNNTSSNDKEQELLVVDLGEGKKSQYSSKDKSPKKSQASKKKRVSKK